MRVCVCVRRSRLVFLCRVIGLLQIRNLTITHKKDYRSIVQDLNLVLKD